MSIGLYLFCIFVLLAIGSPISVSFLTGSVLFFVTNGLNPMLAIKTLINGNFQFILLAVPFFILAAQVMNEGKITAKLFDFADRLVGHIPGGLSHVNILTSIIFAGMSGSSIADVSGIGAMSAQAMIDKGYPKPYSVAVTVSSGIIGPIIPPSIPIVLYAVGASVSVGALFIGAIVPGLMMGIALFIYCYFVAVKRNYPRSPKSNFRQLVHSAKDSFFPLMTPVILIGGIYTGVFTPTEAAVVASLYAIVMALFMDGPASLKKLIPIGIRVVKLTSNVLFMVATITLFNWIISYEQVPLKLTAIMMDLSLPKSAFLLMLNIFLLIAGCFLESSVLLLVLAPMLAPLVSSYGVSLVHFGIIMVVNIMIGQTTPPFGLQLFVASGILDISINKIVKQSWPMLLVLIVVLFLITYIEPLVMWLPGTMN